MRAIHVQRVNPVTAAILVAVPAAVAGFLAATVLLVLGAVCGNEGMLLWGLCASAGGPIAGFAVGFFTGAVAAGAFNLIAPRAGGIILFVQETESYADADTVSLSATP